MQALHKNLHMEAGRKINTEYTRMIFIAAVKINKSGITYIIIIAIRFGL